MTDPEVWKHCFEIARKNGWKHEDNNPFIYPIESLDPKGGYEQDVNGFSFGDSYGWYTWNFFELLFDTSNGFAKALFGEGEQDLSVSGERLWGWEMHLKEIVSNCTPPTTYLRDWIDRNYA